MHFANLKTIFERDEFGRITKGIDKYCNVYLYNLFFVNENFISKTKAVVREAN